MAMRKDIDRYNESIEKIYEGAYGYNAPFNPMKVDLKDRVALITGGTGMIGGATATLMAQCGAKVVVWGRRDAEGAAKEEELRSYGVEAYYDRVDLADKDAIAPAVQRVLDRFGRIDILFANAGVNWSNRKPVNEYDISLFNGNIDINLTNGSIYLAQLVLPTMMKQMSGNIVFTTSVCGYTGLRKQCGFVASKFGMAAITRSMALEYAKYNIRVNALAPGSLPLPTAKLNHLWDTVSFDDYDSNFTNPASMVFDISAKRPAYPSDMAGIVVHLCSDDASYTTGQMIQVDGGWTAGLSGDY